METLVKKIHKEIDSAQDELLLTANMVIENIKNESTIKKGMRLESLGFTSTPDVIKSKQQIAELKENEALARLIINYSREYPFLKFITNDKFDKICNKYNLIYAPVKHYIKDIPEKNIKELENIQPLKSNHRVNEVNIKIIDNYIDDNNLTIKQKLKLNNTGIIVQGTFNNAYEYILAIQKYYNNYNIKFTFHFMSQFEIKRIDKSGLFIAAPKSHFNLTGLKKYNKGFFNVFKVEPTDPIVFRYVDGGIQILTKWGDEADDPNLTVPTLN